MRELVLVFPDLHPLPDDVAIATEDPLRLRFGAPHPLVGGWRAALARELGRPDLALAAPAEIVAAARGLGAAEWWLATPMHWQAGLASVHVPADAMLSLADDELAEIAAAFAAVFGADGFELLPIAGGHWLLRGFATAGADVAEPERLLGTTLDATFVHGPGAGAVRAFGSEIEMWLHDLPINRRREQAGLPRICALWLWGGGVMRRDGIAASSPATGANDLKDYAATKFYGADPWLRAACALSGQACAWPEVDAADSVDAALRAATPRSVIVGAFDRAGYEAAVSLLQRGTISRLTLLGSDRSTRLERRDRLKFWRPRRSLLEALT